MPVPNAETRRLLDQQDWSDLIERLTAHAVEKVRGLRWRGERNGPPVAGKQADDYALEAVKKVLTGERNWDCEAHPNLFRYLCGVVDSLVSNDVRGPDNQARMLDDKLSEVLSGRDQTEAVDEERQAEEFVNGFRAFLEKDEGDIALLRMVDCLLDGCTKRAEIAERLTLFGKDVTNMQKRLQRRMMEYCDLRDGNDRRYRRCRLIGKKHVRRSA